MDTRPTESPCVDVLDLRSNDDDSPVEVLTATKTIICSRSALIDGSGHFRCALTHFAEGQDACIDLTYYEPSHCVEALLKHLHGMQINVTSDTTPAIVHCVELYIAGDYFGPIQGFADSLATHFEKILGQIQLAGLDGQVNLEALFAAANLIYTILPSPDVALRTPLLRKLIDQHGIREAPEKVAAFPDAPPALSTDLEAQRRSYKERRLRLHELARQRWIVQSQEIYAELSANSDFRTSLADWLEQSQARFDRIYPAPA